MFLIFKSKYLSLLVFSYLYIYSIEGEIVNECNSQEQIGQCSLVNSRSTSTQVGNISDQAVVKQEEKESNTELVTEDDLLNEIQKYGKPQLAYGNEKQRTLKVIESSIKYMRNFLKASSVEEASTCQNEYDLCAFWAGAGECEKNEVNMQTLCAPSCKSCRYIKPNEVRNEEKEKELVREINRFGVPQEISGDPKEKNETIDVIRKSINYLNNIEYRYNAKIKNNCRNSYELCAFWESRNHCATNMHVQRLCGPVCRTCHIFDETIHVFSEVELMKAVELYGVTQRVDGDTKAKTLETIRSSIMYMRNLNDANTLKRCRNEYGLCSYWASMGECNINHNMKRICAPSCNSCDALSVITLSDDDLLREVQRYGVAQRAEGKERLETLNIIRSSIDYMQNLDDAIVSPEIQVICKNKKDLCAFWASIGECESNPSLKTMCAPSCQSCEMLDVNVRCPPRDTSQVPAFSEPGDLNNLFNRIISDATLNITIHSQPEKDKIGLGRDPSPWVITIDDFLTHDECDTLVEVGYLEGFEQSTNVGAQKADGTAERLNSTTRTSNNAWCHQKCLSNPVVQNIYKRIENLLQIPSKNYEDFQILRYYEGQFYKQHHDFIPRQVERACGPRILTFFQYLSDVEEGGSTAFPLLDIVVAPKKGRVLLWPSCLDEDPNERDDRMDHAALPVNKGVKYAANAWIHLYDYKTPNIHDCT